MNAFVCGWVGVWVYYIAYMYVRGMKTGLTIISFTFYEETWVVQGESKNQNLNQNEITIEIASDKNIKIKK